MKNVNKMFLDYNCAVNGIINNGITSEEFDTQLQKAHKGFAGLADMVKSGSVGFPDLPYQKLDDIKNIAKDLYRKYNDLVIIGIGGSSLGFEALANAMLPSGYNSLSFSDRKGFPRYWLLDNSDPSLVNSVVKYCNQEDTFVLVISKSGTTLEAMVNFTVIYEWLKEEPLDLKKHICVVTDQNDNPLRKFANDKGLRCFTAQNNVGGRYSVLSPAGLLPAAMLGIDVDKLLEGAAKIVESDWRQFTAMAALYMHFMERGRSINVLMPYTSRLSKFAEWFCQLWGESLGKRYDVNGKEVFFGSTPLRAIGALDQHSLLQLFLEGPEDKFITFISLEAHEHDKMLREEFAPSFSYLKGHKMGEMLNAEMKSTEAALTASSRPSMRIDLSLLDEASLGQLFMLFQYVVAIIGIANNIDPFTQQGVEDGKNFAYGIMGRKGYEDKKKEFESLYVKYPEFII